MNAEEVTLVVHLKADAAHREECINTLFDIMERSRIAPECFCYELFSRADDENTLILLQTWGTREAFERNWLYTDLPRINSNSDLLEVRPEFWEVLPLSS